MAHNNIKSDIPVKILNIEEPTPDVRIVYAQPLKIYDYKAGQYTFIQTDEDEELARPFSIANAPNDENIIEFHIKYTGFSVSEWIFKKAAKGSIFSISDPQGDCTYTTHQHSQRPILAISGGVGISQIKAILEQLITNHSAREIILYEGVKRSHDLYLIEYWENLEDQHEGFEFRPVFSEEDMPEDKFMRTGLVGHQVCMEIDNLDAYDIYLAGPPAMITDIVPRLIEKGADPTKIYKD